MQRPSGASTPLRLNGYVSLVQGAAFAVAPGLLGGWLDIDIDIDGWLRLFGIALIGHGALLLWAAARPDNHRWTLLNLAVIAPYPLIMFGIVIGELVERPLGQALVLADGAIIAILAIAQWKAARAPMPEAASA